MGSTNRRDHVSDFTVQVLRTGFMLCDMGSELVEGMSPDAYPGRDTGTVFIEMLTGTIRTAFDEVPRREVERATELLALVSARVLEHLRLAVELRARMEGEGPPRTYG